MYEARPFHKCNIGLYRIDVNLDHVIFYVCYVYWVFLNDVRVVYVAVFLRERTRSL